MEQEFFKRDVKMRAIERSSVLKREQEKVERELNDLLKELLSEESFSPGLFTDDSVSLKKRLEALDIGQYLGASVRARLIDTHHFTGMERRFDVKNESEILYQGTLSSERRALNMHCATLQRAF